MNKPLHKNPLFWIGAITLLVAADGAQFYFGFSWLAGKLAAQNEQAPRIALNGGGAFIGQRQNPPHAPGEWQLPYFEQNIFQSASNVVAILPSKFEMPSGPWNPDNPPQGGWSTRQQDKAIGIRFPAEFVIQTAYRWNSRSRTLFQDRPPSGQFDFIANIPSDGFEALQQKIRELWGLTGDFEKFQTNAMVLVVGRPGVLKPFSSGRTDSGPNTINLGTVQNMASFLENILNSPILDQTGLTGRFELRFPMSAINGPGIGSQMNQRTATIKKLLEDQFGLDLIQTNTSVEMLVVKKVGLSEAQSQGANR